MSEYLEALKQIKASHLQTHIDSENIGDFDIWFGESYGTLEQVLTPPTADEVCEVYYKYHKIKLLYKEKQQMFEEIKGGRARGKIVARKIDNNIMIPHLINEEVAAMITKFYRGVK